MEFFHDNMTYCLIPVCCTLIFLHLEVMILINWFVKMRLFVTSVFSTIFYFLQNINQVLFPSKCWKLLNIYMSLILGLTRVFRMHVHLSYRPEGFEEERNKDQAPANHHSPVSKQVVGYWLYFSNVENVVLLKSVRLY